MESGKKVAYESKPGKERGATSSRHLFIGGQ
jgi:hypothetical protein